MLNKAALVKAGWTPALITAVLGAPDQVEQHRRGYQRWVEHLYAPERVRRGQDDPRFVAAAEQRRVRAAAADARRRAIPTRYPSWRDALPEAAAGLFALNRYAKHRRCSALHRVEIYGLKNEFIRALWGHGFCTQSWIHRLVQEARVCRECGGDGGDWACDRCGGSGVWRAARTLEFWCFRFLVAGRTYCWHQPRESVQFAPREDLPPQEWEGLGGERPVVMPRRRFAASKDLLRWVVDAAEAEAAQAAESPAGAPAEAQLTLFVA